MRLFKILEIVGAIAIVSAWCMAYIEWQFQQSKGPGQAHDLGVNPS